MSKKVVINFIGFLMFVAMGIYLLCSFGSVAKHESEVKNWTPTRAVIYQVFREESRKRFGPGKIPQLRTGVRYSYVVNNQEYRGETAMSDGDARTYFQGQEITVRVNPNNPEESDYNYISDTQGR